MKPVRQVHGVAAPLRQADIDTDTIVPQRWMVTTTRQGLRQGFFAHQRQDPAFVLNESRYAGAKVLIAGPNYGCGSSREHAVWAHLDAGIEAVLAASFGPIFRDNAPKNGLLLVTLPPAVIEALQHQLDAPTPQHVTVDLVACTVQAPDGQRHRFEIEAATRQALLDGLDPIAQTLAAHRQAIDDFQRHDRATRPWVWTPTA